MGKLLAGAKHAKDTKSISEAELIEALPLNLQKAVTSKTVAYINNLVHDEELQINFRETLLGYTSVVREGKYRLEDYISAVKWVCFKQLGDTDIQAYRKVHPERYAKHTAYGVPENRIRSYVNAYKSTDLVQRVVTAAAMPMELMYQDYRMHSIEHLHQLMYEAKSEKVQMDSADKLLTHLAPPQTQKSEHKLSVEMGKESQDAMAALRKATEELARAQQQSIEAGGSDILHGIANGTIIDAETYEDDD